MKTGVKIFPKTKGSRKRRQARRESVALKREISSLREAVNNSVPQSLPGSPDPGVKMGTIRAIERRMQDKDKVIEGLTVALKEVADSLPAKVKNKLSDNTKLILKLE